MVDIASLQAAISQAAPNATVYIGDPSDKTTWGCVFDASDTDAQKQAAVGVIDNWVDPVRVPSEVTNYQARAALIDAGLFAQVDSAIHSQGVDPKAVAAWDYGNTFLRTSPFVTMMAATLGMTSDQVDALFTKAATYTT